MGDSRAIGVFDSGLGGLTVAKRIMELMPEETIVYFGDTGRVPYGTKGVDTIKKYAVQDERFLISQDVKMVVAACGTVSSVAAGVSCTSSSNRVGVRATNSLANARYATAPLQVGS